MIIIIVIILMVFICVFFLSSYNWRKREVEGKMINVVGSWFNFFECWFCRDSYLRFFFVIRLIGCEKCVGGFDLIWNDGLVYMDDISGVDCILNFFYFINMFLGKIL